MINKYLNIDVLNGEYNKNKPNYIVIDKLFDNSFIKECETEFLAIENTEFIKYSNKYFEYEKYAMNDTNRMPEKLSKLFDYIHSDEFIEFVSKVTSIENLYVDERRWGGGLHKTNPSGYLSIHKDFNVLPETYNSDVQMLRCVNLIGYITDENTENCSGDLEFWDEDEQCLHRINNKFNSWILFDTRDNYHGHPYPYKGVKSRMSIASYYYIKTTVDVDVWKSTQYIKLPWMEESQEYIDSRIERSNSKKRYKEFYKNE